MTPEQFCYWLQGFIELAGNDLEQINAARIQVIRDHLDLVFNKVTPDRRQTLNEEIDKAKGKKKRTLEETIKEIERTQDDVYCNPFDPHRRGSADDSH